MREIKFRAWNGIKMVVPEIIDNNGQWYEDWREWENGIRRDGALMQFTGLRDKNGVEIYEGDVVETTDGFEKYVVVYIPEDAVYWFQRGKTYIPAGTNLCTVVGNIYQNQELLK